MMSKFAIAALLSTASATSWAGCDHGSQTLFSCTTSSVKQIELCDAGETIQYSFGKVHAKPDLVLSVPRSQASTYQWQGFGRDHTYSVHVPNGKTAYEVFNSDDALDPKHALNAGVNVLVNGDRVATVQCSPKYPVINHLVDVDLKPSE